MGIARRGSRHLVPEPTVLTNPGREGADSVACKILDVRPSKTIQVPRRFAIVLDAAETTFPNRVAILLALRSDRSAWSIELGDGAYSGSDFYGLRWRGIGSIAPSCQVEAPQRI